ncbi:MAG: Translation initiation factor IF-3 [Phycisphaerae bacterium]|nr:Translation initiation factor IF-3 [Phycisphaerae bacterium]
MNEQIRISPVRLIDQLGEQVGVVPTAEALARAREAGLDLVEIAPNERPPVCKIMDFGKYKYIQKKKQRLQHKQAHEIQTKELRMRPKTDTHDRDIKLAKARDFLEEGDKVQFSMIFKGRENAHKDIGMGIFNEIITALADIAKVEAPAKFLGKRLNMVLAPLKLKPPTAKPKPAKPAEAKTAESKPPATEPAVTEAPASNP